MAWENIYDNASEEREDRKVYVSVFYSQRSKIKYIDRKMSGRNLRAV